MKHPKIAGLLAATLWASLAWPLSQASAQTLAQHQPHPASSASKAALSASPKGKAVSTENAVKVSSKQRKNWPLFDRKTTPVVDLAGFGALIRSGHVLDAVIVERSAQKSNVFVRMDTGWAWQLKLNTLLVPDVMQILDHSKVKTAIEKTETFETQARNNSTPWWKGILSGIPIGQILGQILFFMVLIFAMVWAQLKASKMMTGKRIRAVKPKDIPVTFDDVAGIDEAVRDVREAVAFMAEPDKFSRLGARLPKGILLVGPPGGGKTLLAKAFARASDAPFYAVSGSEFVEMYVGLGASRIRALFKKARKSKKAVIFIDEIDALTRKRGGVNSHSEAEQTLNELLVQMDGLDPGKSQIIVIGATNRVDAMDDAILRPGRFDRQIHISEPSLQGREDILKVYLKGHLEGSDINPHTLARISIGFSGAQLANWVNEALIRAAREGKDALSQDDMIVAREKILLGDPRKDVTMSDEERRNTAYHEAGHAVVALATSKDPVEKVTIQPRSRALGLMLQVPEREAYSLKTSEARSKLMVFMGGRAAEEIFMKDVTSGASSDMSRAYEFALRMVSQWGMGEVMGKNGVAQLDALSQGLREAVEREARDLVNASYEKAKSIVQEHRDVMERMAAALLERETIDRDEVDRLWDEREQRQERHLQEA